MIRSYWVFAIPGILLLSGCDGRPGNEAHHVHERVIKGDGATKITADIWVDNWFALAINGEPLIEDSVAYETERSFNAEQVTFSADFPMTIAFELRDFKEDDTGLEYIGSSRQQIGDGGAIAQFRNVDTGAIIAVTDKSWKCSVIHRAPVDAACAHERNPEVGEGSCQAQISEAPSGWQEEGFDDGHWAAAVEHSSSDVGPKDGYDEIDWHPGARLIWGKDLKLDNIVLCRKVIEGR